MRLTFSSLICLLFLNTSLNVASAEDLEGGEEVKQQEKEDSSRWKFGGFKIDLGVQQPDFDDEKGFIDFSYGKESKAFYLSNDYYFINKFIGLGLGFSISFYSDKGNAFNSTKIPPESVDDLIEDKEGGSELTILPVQTYLTMQFSPFPKKWIVLYGRYGFERSYIQIVRITSSETNSSEEDSGAFTNKLFKNAQVMHVGLSFLLNFLDPRSVASMENTLGIGYVYLTPFYEIVKPLKEEGMQVSRKSMGISFTFESLF